MNQNKDKSFYVHGMVIINLCLSFLSYQLKTTVGGLMAVIAKLYNCPTVNELLKDRVTRMESNLGFYSIITGVLSIVLALLIAKLELTKIVKILNIAIAVAALLYSIIIVY